ncbi:MAG: LysM peptidoglycan-binding domain-containing protein [bacterium]
MRPILIALVAVALLGAPTLLWAEEKLTKEEAEEMIEGYKLQLQECNERVSDLDGDVSALEREIRSLDAKIDALEKEIADLKSMRASTYTVKEGDWLAKLAEYPEVYGHGNYALWPRIYRANKDKIKDPDLIYPGQVLIIPRLAGGAK